MISIYLYIKFTIKYSEICKVFFFKEFKSYSQNPAQYKKTTPCKSKYKMLHFKTKKLNITHTVQDIKFKNLTLYQQL